SLCFFFYWSCHHRHLHSFPTRRSSDLVTNRSSVPIEVTGLKLYDCENIRNPCDVAVALKVRLEPGRRQTVYTLKVANTERRSSLDRKSTRLNSSHDQISYAVFCLKKKK